MKERLEDNDPKNLADYVSGIKDNIKRRYSHYKMTKIREHYKQGLEFEEKADYKKAIRNFLACLEIEPDNWKIMKHLANLYSNLEESSKSLELFSKIVKLHPDEETYYLLGQEHYKQNRFKKAIECLKKSLYYNKRYINSHILLATIFARAENTDKAQQYLSNALKIDPNHKTCLEDLMKCYFRQGRYRDSLHVLNYYSSIYVEDSSLKILKTDIYIKLGSYAKALKLLYQTTASDDRFANFIKEMQYRRINPTAREKEFTNRITAIKNQKLVSFKSNLPKYYNDPDGGVSPNPKDAYDLSILYLLIGNQKKALKYLLFARQLNEEKKYS